MSEIKFFQQVINILRGTADILLRILCYLVFILSASWARQAPGRGSVCFMLKTRILGRGGTGTLFVILLEKLQRHASLSRTSNNFLTIFSKGVN